MVLGTDGEPQGCPDALGFACTYATPRVAHPSPKLLRSCFLMTGAHHTT